MTERVLGRSAWKRQTILSAGRELFLSNGYQGTSVDQIAASAEVSKQTVYKHFGDKHELLLAIVDNALESSVTPFLERIARMADTNDLETDLTALAGDYLGAVLQEPVV
ncbi:MAG TPA: TetR/AcrR family transcriptional regulator, partial [Mycobacterium sp.]|nr:TetR/AcrR family transcriptional regulator [Mycobacterium sp.]